MVNYKKQILEAHKQCLAQAVALAYLPKNKFFDKLDDLSHPDIKAVKTLYSKREQSEALF